MCNVKVYQNQHISVPKRLRQTTGKFFDFGSASHFSSTICSTSIQLPFLFSISTIVNSNLATIEQLQVGTADDLSSDVSMTDESDEEIQGSEENIEGKNLIICLR